MDELYPGLSPDQQQQAQEILKQQGGSQIGLKQ